jgi:hypothetical protein
LLSAIETSKEYKNILLGYPIIVFTNHKNNTFNGLKASDRILSWLSTFEEYGVTFEYLPRIKQKNVVADAFLHLDIDSLKIQEEEVLTLLSGWENNSISNINWKTPMHTALIFKEQAKVKEAGLREMGLVQPHYSIHHIEGYDLVCYKDNKQDLHSSIIETNSKEYCPGTMNIYFIRDRLELKRLSGIPWHGLVLHKIMSNDCLCSTCQVCQMTKKESTHKKYGLIPPKIAKSDSEFLDQGLCGSVGFIYNKDTSQNTFSACTHNDRSSHCLVWNCQSHK